MESSTAPYVGSPLGLLSKVEEISQTLRELRQDFIQLSKDLAIVQRRYETSTGREYSSRKLEEETCRRAKSDWAAVRLYDPSKHGRALRAYTECGDMPFSSVSSPDQPWNMPSYRRSYPKLTAFLQGHVIAPLEESVIAISDPYESPELTHVRRKLNKEGITYADIRGLLGSRVHDPVVTRSQIDANPKHTRSPIRLRCISVNGMTPLSAHMCLAVRPS